MELLTSLALLRTQTYRNGVNVMNYVSKPSHPES